MTTVYELITEICTTKDISLRQLAIYANMPPSTLSSIMTRRVPMISKRTLWSIARVFDLNWEDLVTLPHGAHPESIKAHKVPADLSRDQKDKILMLVSKADLNPQENGLRQYWNGVTRQWEPQTNLDFLRNHSQEDVAKFLADEFCNGHGYKMILNWLGQKYEE
jgi:transcriptional regulator with XRE-family HTH domain